MENQITTNVAGFLTKDYLENALRVANIFFKAGAFGKDVQNAEQAFVKIQAGAEMGMAPMEAMNSLYIVNGKVTIWGSAIIKKIKDAGYEITYPVSTATDCHMVVSKDDKTYEYKANKADIPKSNALGFAPKEKLVYHCASRIVRFYIPEVLGHAGSEMYTPEEVDYMSTVPSAPVSSVAMPTVSAEQVSEADFMAKIKKEPETPESVPLTDDNEPSKVNPEVL